MVSTETQDRCNQRPLPFDTTVAALSQGIVVAKPN